MQLGGFVDIRAGNRKSGGGTSGVAFVEMDDIVFLFTKRKMVLVSSLRDDTGGCPETEHSTCERVSVFYLVLHVDFGALPERLNDLAVNHTLCLPDIRHDRSPPFLNVGKLLALPQLARRIRPAPLKERICAFQMRLELFDDLLFVTEVRAVPHQSPPPRIVVYLVPPQLAVLFLYRTLDVIHRELDHCLVLRRCYGDIDAADRAALVMQYGLQDTRRVEDVTALEHTLRTVMDTLQTNGTIVHTPRRTYHRACDFFRVIARVALNARPRSERCGNNHHVQVTKSKSWRPSK